MGMLRGEPAAPCRWDRRNLDASQRPTLTPLGEMLMGSQSPSPSPSFAHFLAEITRDQRSHLRPQCGFWGGRGRLSSRGKPLAGGTEPRTLRFPVPAAVPGTDG